MLIAFDVDETLGAFSAFSEYCHQVAPKITYELFRLLLDQNPMFLRPHILDILSIVKTYKILSNKKVKVVMYTNNQGEKSWVDMIRRYLEDKLQYALFDQVIRAYKINGVQIESRRTRHDKSLKDLLACTRCSSKIKVFFVDDQLHPEMIKDTVSYFQIRPYSLPCSDVDPSVHLKRYMLMFLEG
jgi:hypothetical protein